MACLITKGRKIQCKEFIGGLYKIWFANYGTINPVIGADSVITNFSGTTALFEYELKGTSKLDQTMTSNSDNGTTFVTQTLTLDLQGGDYSFNNEIKLLAYGRPHVFVQNNYGTVFYAGRFRGMNVDTALHTSGGAISEKFGYTLTLTGIENEYANYVSGSTITDAWAGMTTKPTVTVGT